MGTSFVSLGERGFWAQDREIESWLELAVERLGNDRALAPELAAARDVWLDEARCGAVGCLSPRFDELLASPPARAAAQRLAGVIEKSSAASTGPHVAYPPLRMERIARAFRRLLGGEMASTHRNPGRTLVSEVAYRGHGFWTGDSRLQMWLYALARSMQRHGERSTWQREIAEHWMHEARIADRFIEPRFDELADDEVRRQYLVDVVGRALADLPHMTRANDELRAVHFEDVPAWNDSITVDELARYGHVVHDLLQGRLAWTLDTDTAMYWDTLHGP